MSDARIEIEPGEAIRHYLERRGASPDAAIQLLAERYMAFVESAYTPFLSAHERLIRYTVEELGVPLSVQQIKVFPALVEDYVRRHPEFPPATARMTLAILKRCEFQDLLPIVEKTERSLPKPEGRA
ncbi:MAG TPA: hypothetical protein VIY27_07055 [Myxococcota bacterium]